MRSDELTKQKIRGIFGEKTYAKGLKYFNEGRVKSVIKVDNLLLGSVQGTADLPYLVRVDLKTLENRCSCPLGGDCKHVVALLLAYIKGNYTDTASLADRILKLNREDLISILKEIAFYNPELLSSLEEAITLNTIRKGGTQKGKESHAQRQIYKKLKKRINNIFMNADLSYYGVPSLVSNIERIFNMITNNKSLDNLKKIDLLIYLLENIIDCFDSGVDDSSGSLGDTAIYIAEELKTLLDSSNQAKNQFAKRITTLVAREDYGLEFESLIPHIATAENYKQIINTLKEELLYSGARLYYIEKFVRILDNISEVLNLEIPTEEYIEDTISKMDFDSINKWTIDSLIKHNHLELAIRIIEHAIQNCLTNKWSEKPRITIRFGTFRRLVMAPGNAPSCIEDLIGILKDIPIEKIDKNLLKRFLLKATKYDFYRDDLYYILRSLINKAQIREIELKPILDETAYFYFYTNNIEKAIEKISEENAGSPLTAIIIREALENKKYRQKAMEKITTIIRHPLHHELLQREDILEHIATNTTKQELKQILQATLLIIIRNRLLEKIYRKTQHKETILDIIQENTELIPKETIKNIIKNTPKPNQKLINTALKWINNKANKSHKYYQQCIEILETLKQKTTQKQWEQIKKELTTKHKTKRKLIKRLQNI